MTLFVLLAVMTALAAFAVLWPLARQPKAASTGHDLRVYRDQLDEIARDMEAGRIGESEAEAARIEVSRRLLAAGEQEAAAAVPGPASRRRAVALVALLLLPLLSAGLYLSLGSPLLTEPRMAARGGPTVEQLVGQIEAHLQANAEDGRGWEVVAPVYMQLGRFEDAARARQNAITYNGATATREADLGEALVAVAKGIVTPDAKRAFERALTLDAREAKARYFLGRFAEQDGRPVEAVAAWRELLTSAPPGASWAEFVRDELARLDPNARPMAPGPSTEDMAAAEQMDPQQRQQMITTMVAGLAERLKQNGGDFEGWLRLVRAYTVLGERDKARVAASDARRTVGDDADKLRRLDALVKELGLEG